MTKRLLEAEAATEDDISGGYTEKRALLVGCSYWGMKSQLNGVARDIYRSYEWLQKPPMNIPKENITVLSDFAPCAKECNAIGKPTAANIKKAMRDLALSSGPGTLQAR